MIDEVTLPSIADVAELFEMLFGREIEIAPTGRLLLTPGEHFWAAVYADDIPRLRGVLVCDAELAVRVSAALSLFPPHQVGKLVARGELDETLRENLHEVCNVASGLFQANFTNTVRVARVFEVPNEAPDPLFQLIETAGQRRDLRLKIQGYGQGRLALLMA